MSQILEKYHKGVTSKEKDQVKKQIGTKWTFLQTQEKEKHGHNGHVHP